MKWTKELFGTSKPIIAMCHLQSLPGDPKYDKAAGMEKVVEAALEDLTALQNGGVDGIMFSNEFSLPYLTKVDAVTTACMARIIGELMDKITVPFGVNALWDAEASLDLAVATGAKFVREIFSGVYASDFGLWNTNVGKTVRHQYAIGADKVKLLFNIVPEAAKYLADRDIKEIAKTTVFNTRPDALCVSGLTAGSGTDSQIIKLVKETVPDTIVFANTGVNINTLEQQLSVSDGAVVATTFKYDGIFENKVDEIRVKAFMDKAKEFRKQFD